MFVGGSQNSAQSRRHLAARLIRAVVGATLMLASLLVLSPAANAQPAIQAEAGFGDLFHQGRDIPIRVVVNADRLIDGELHIRSSDFSIPGPTLVIPIEIAGGSSKEFTAVFPGSVFFSTSIRIDLVEDDDVIASSRVSPDDARGNELVGVLASFAADAPPNAALTVDLKRATISPLTQNVLNAGIGAIDTLDIVLGTASDLAALDEPAQQTLRDWVHSGRVLLIDDPPGTPLPGFDLALAEVGSSIPVGRGTVRSTDGAAGRGDYDSIFAPTASHPLQQGFMSEISGDFWGISNSMASELSLDAGFRLPDLPWVLAMLGLYLLIIGPVGWFVLRRLGRLRLLWFLVPAASLLFTFGVWVAGSAVRSDVKVAHGTLIEVTTTGAQAHSAVLLNSRNGGSVELNLPARWYAAQDQSQRWGGQGPGGAAPVFYRTGEGERVEAKLDAGGVVLLSASGPLPAYADALVVTASSSQDDQTAGLITNNLDFAVHDVAVFVDSEAKKIGTIEAGETVDYTVRGAGNNQRFNGPIEFEVWPDATGGRFNEFGRVEQSVTVNLSLWDLYKQSQDRGTRPIGEVVVAAWTPDLASPLNAEAQGRSLLIARATTVPEAAPTNVSIVRELLRSPEQMAGGEPNFNNNRGFVVGSAWRFVLPQGIAAEAVALELPNGVDKVEIWVGDDWLEVEEPENGRYQLSSDLLSEGDLYVKLWVDFEGPGGFGRSFTVSSIAADDEVLPFNFVADTP